VTTGAWILLAAAAVVAVADWLAVIRERKPLEYVCKPLTIALLIGVALALDVDDATARNWFVAALVLSLIGDVCLMLPSDVFVPGLVSFLLGHVAYIVGLWSRGIEGLPLLFGILIVLIAILTIGRTIVHAVRHGPEPGMALPVTAYMLVISTMWASAIGTAIVLAIIGAGLFYSSDAMIAWERFVRPHRWHRLGIIVTYHLGQAALVLSLAV
jgi:uncharacterized membrane protein YhhN